jgi:hypothetical protein
VIVQKNFLFSNFSCREWQTCKFEMLSHLSHSTWTFQERFFLSFVRQGNFFNTENWMRRMEFFVLKKGNFQTLI